MKSSQKTSVALARRPVALAVGLLLASAGLAHAQSVPSDAAPTSLPAAAPATPPATSSTATPAAAPAAEAPTLATVTVSASGLQLGSSELATPVTVLEGDELVQRRAATLGDTLDGMPGISASHFGAGASRPIIRGMDGPRVKILSDGSELQDASTVSPDHAVASSPLLARQIEVLRGPSALLYGGGAVGGVVNVLDDKVPTAIPEKGYTGSAELRAGSNAREKAGAFALTGGAGQLALHVEGAANDAQSYRAGSGWPQGARVPGSYQRGDTGSVGLSWIDTDGYLGAAYTRQTAKYGLPGDDAAHAGCGAEGNRLVCPADAEPAEAATDATAPMVDLLSERWDLRGELRNPFAGVAAVRLRSGLTHYRHNEIEDGAIGTTFNNRAYDSRIELEHLPIAGWRGLVGLQLGQRDFRADGEESYIEPTATHKIGLFALEEYRWRDWRFEAALRHDRQSVEAQSSGIEREHHGTSASLGAVWKFTPGYALGASLTRAVRLPTAEELYAQGLHLATRTYERGNADLRAETAQNIDLSLRKMAGDTTFELSVFRNHIANYIYGRTVDELGGLQLLQYSQQDATFTGFEGQVRQRLTRHLGLTLRGDAVRASLDDGSRVPRMPAARVGLRLDGSWGPWQGYTEWLQVARQDRTAAFETPTPGYGMLNMGLSYGGTASGAFGQRWQLYLKANNLNNRLAYASTSFIKTAAPLMGRDITLGLRVEF